MLTDNSVPVSPCFSFMFAPLLTSLPVVQWSDMKREYTEALSDKYLYSLRVIKNLFI